MDSPELLSYLRESGGLPERDATQRGAPIGPLSHRQVAPLLTYPNVTCSGPRALSTSVSFVYDPHELCTPSRQPAVQHNLVLLTTVAHRDEQSQGPWKVTITCDAEYR